MPEKVRIFSPGERISIGISFVCEGGSEIESVEAVFAREGSDTKIHLLGDVGREAFGGEEETTYSARLEAEVKRGIAPGDYRCVRLTARDRFDDDWEFEDAARLDLVVRVQGTPSRLEVTASDFL